MKHDDQSFRIDGNTYNETIDYLYGLQLHGIKLGLKNIGRLLNLLDNPHKTFRSVHIAGTNGKGSVASFIASVLRRAGYKVGMFTSPHLVSFTERIRVNGIQINRAEIIRATNHIRKLINAEKELKPTFFEFVTAMAFHYFRTSGVQWAVVETGMGGRLDATNTLSPEITVITRIGMDHMEYLGNTLEDIAGEKAGIIKKGIPVVTGRQDDRAIKVIREEAGMKQSPVYSYGRDFGIQITGSGIKGSRFDYSSGNKIMDIFIPLGGYFQPENASAAIKALEIIGCPELSNDIIREGLASTRWEGRCELVHWKYPILFDGAHNPDAAQSLGKTLKGLYLKEFKDIIFIMGSMEDKDIDGHLRYLLPLGRLIIFTTLGFHRAATAEGLRAISKKAGLNSIIAGDMAEALELAGTHYREGDLVAVTGSFYAVGEAKGVIGCDSSLIGLTEFR